MNQGSDNRMIPMTSVDSGKTRELRPDIAYFTDQIVNVGMIGMPGGEWVLIDAGMPGSGDDILKAAKRRFGDKNPSAIILTHGHFDHVGSIVQLLETWKVPVYAHLNEFPFLTGVQAYPEPDTSVQGGMLAKISSIYPVEPINIREALHKLPSDGSVPLLNDWEWIHVPGHSPGQVALYRALDGVLISADAFITVRQDSLYRVLLQKIEVCGPPVYLTTDWDAAYESVLKLASLNPDAVLPGHGTAIEGEDLKHGLSALIKNWHEEAVPDHGKWVHE